MRLRKEHIEKIANLVFTELKSKNLIKLRVAELPIKQKIIEIITRDMMKEAAIDKEAKDMLDKFRGKIQSGELDEHRAFQMIKKQLAKDKNFVL